MFLIFINASFFSIKTPLVSTPSPSFRASSRFFFATGVAWILWNLLNPLGFAAVFAGLSLWAFEPSFLAYSGYALADVPAAFFFLLSTLFFVFSKRSPGVFSETLSGLFLGLAILSKFYNLILFIVFLILEKTEITCDSMHLRLRRWLLALGLPFFLVGLAFSGATQKHFYDPWLVFFENLKDLLAYRLENRPGYLFGETFQEFRMAYYPWVLFFKTSLPLLFLSIIGLMALIPHRKDAWLWVPGIAYFSVTLFSQTVGGVRYLMPLYPFLFLWGALGFHRLWTRQGTYRRAARFGAGGLLLWQAISSAASWPQHLAYFNDFVPPSQKMFVLGDNNYDIGQNNRRFARWWRNQNLPPVRLALLGGRDPYFYGLRWEPWHESDLSAPEPGTVYAVNAAFLQIAPALFPYTRAIAESWIRKIPPTARVAETWFVWIFPGKPAEKKEKVFVYSCPFLSYYRTVDSRRTFPWPAPPPSAVRF